MSVYVYQGSGMSTEGEETEKDRDWQAYELDNAKANHRYAEDKSNIDARYDPHGGGRRWAKRKPYTRRRRIT